jgi:phospho-N-acetylmuramoyl-pentapeptide-transferase
MGGLIILAAILIPTLLFAQIHNIYVILMLIATIWLGALGFLDDYIKTFKKSKEGLAARFKIIGQVGVGVLVGAMLFFNQDVMIKRKLEEPGHQKEQQTLREKAISDAPDVRWEETRSTKTTIPFVKNNEFDYAWLLGFMGDQAAKYAWILFIPITIFIVTFVSNGVNMSDGLDGLATGSSAVVGGVLAIFAYVSGNYIFADYLNIMFIPSSGELVVFISAFVGACVGFLWYNSYPAQVFMGDTGSLALGGIIAVFAIAIRKELLIPIFCGIFLIENLSVVMQVLYFKYTRSKLGEGKRIFLMAPLHHHYQKKGLHESKIVSRFWIVGVILAVLSIVTLKLR